MKRAAKSKKSKISSSSKAKATSSRRIVLVGHCGPDMHMLAAAMRRVAPESTVAIANDAEELKPHLSGDAVLLVNRVLDDGFETESGIDLIMEITALPDPPVLIMISNYASAQAKAVAAGARPGFGKAQLHDEKTAVIVRNAVARQPI